MSRIQPTFSNRVRYTLQHTQTGNLIIPEPIGWSNDDNEFIRSKVLHGVLTQMTNNLKFVDSGRNFINNVRNIYGIDADLRLVKDEKHPITDEWVRSYDGFLDLSTWNDEDNKVSVKFDSSGLMKLIKSRESEKIELERLDTIDGSVLPEFKKETVALNGRGIFLKSNLETLPEHSYTDKFRMNFSGGNHRTGVVALRSSVKYKSDSLIHSVISTEIDTTPDNLESSYFFYADNDRNKFLNINVNISFNLEAHSIPPFSTGFNNLDNAFFYVCLGRYGNSTSFDIVERDYLTDNLINSTSVKTPQINFSQNINVTLLKGESLSLHFYGGGDFGGSLSSGSLNLDISNLECTINIEENSFFEPSTAKFYLPHKIGQRLVNVISGRNDAFYSEVLGTTDLNYSEDGEASLIGALNGLQVRGFEPTDERYKPFATSWKDFLSSYSAIWNLGMGIEKIGFQERVRIEPLSYFYNKNVLIRIGELDKNGVFQYTQVSKVKRAEIKDKYYSGLEFGFDKIKEYEEANGLDEYNMSSTYTTKINRLEKKYTAKSKYRGDSYGMEFARRKQVIDNPTTDTKYDNSNFLIDLKRGVTNVFEQRLWDDDFEQEPTGVFDPSTATNLRLSPFNMLLRHSWVFGSGLTKYPIDFVKYGSSLANSKLKTKLNGGIEYAENGNIQNQNLEKPRFVPETIEFEHEVNFDLLQQVKGKTVILGKEIQNFYGLIAFKNENGQIEKGFLQNLKPNGSGKWTLLKYNN